MPSKPVDKTDSLARMRSESMQPQTSTLGTREAVRACDTCRRRKVRCDGPDMPNHVCTVCRTGRLDCTYFNPAKRRWPPASYVKKLEDRVEATEQLLHELFPNVDFTAEIGPVITKDNWMYPSTHRTTSSAVEKKPMVPTGPKKRRVRTAASPVHNSEAHSSGEETLYGSDDESRRPLQVSDINTTDPLMISIQTVGKSSNMELSRHLNPKLCLFQRRPQFWVIPKYELRGSLPPSISLELPPRDLLDQLIDTYFRTFSIYFPFLHRGLLEQQIAAGMHVTDNRFAAVLLMVCACASRNLDDPRVLATPGNRRSSGWLYFKQVEPLLTQVGPRFPDIVDLQMMMLGALYLCGSSSKAQLGMALINKGVRLCQDVGAHRNRAYSSTPNLVDEMWKRVFWSMVTADRFMGILTGCRCTILDEDFDLDFPMIVDDSCWDLTDPEHKFPLKPPTHGNEPCVMDYFVCVLKFTQILAYILRSLYSISKFKLLKSPSVIMDIDSSMNEFLSEMPDHLKWDPDRRHPIFAAQSAAIHCAFYNGQILLHRPFMLQPKLGLPSLAICSNAARSISTIMENQLTRYGYWLQCQSPVLLVSSLVLLVDLWQKLAESGREPSHPAYREHWSDINRCMKGLERIETVWYQAGKLLDIVRDLAKISPNCHSLMHQGKVPLAETLSDLDSNPGVLHGHDVLGYPIYTASPPAAHTDSPSTSSDPDPDVATPPEESVLQPQHGAEDHWKLLEAIGMAQMPVEMGSWMDLSSSDLDDPAPELFNMQPYFSLPVDPNSWFDQMSV